MTRPGQMRQPHGDGEYWLLVVAVAATSLVFGLVWSSLQIAATLGSGQDVPGVVAAPILLARGQVAWSSTATVALITQVLLLTGAVVLTLVLWRRRHGTRATVDSAARHMGSLRDVSMFTRNAVQRKADQLGVVVADGKLPGVPIGRHLPTRRELYSNFETLSSEVWGPRRGKTTSRIIPAIVEAPGVVIATSNKRDVVDGTRGVRADAGSAVWVFDPQAVANEEPTWWWNPLSYVVDDVSAAGLAEHFADSADGVDARKDPYFDPEGEDLLATLFLAAKLASVPVTDVYLRLADRSSCREWVGLLDRHGYALAAASLLGKLNLAAKQQDGVFGTAMKMAACLKVRQIAPWITESGRRRPQLDVDELVAGHGTLYALSRETKGNAGPLVTALTVAVCEAAERLATRSPKGRLATPMLCALDEAANVVRWRNLPKLFSHYGSRGIIIMTILQSWSQGVSCWGREGMKQLFDASGVFLYGGASKDTEFLSMLSELVGQYERTATSVSSGRGGSSTSRHTQADTLLTVAHLGGLDFGRAILFGGVKPALIETRPWMDGPHADAIRRSFATYEPVGSSDAVPVTAQELGR